MLLGAEFEQREPHKGRASWRCQGTGFYFLKHDAASNYLTRHGYTIGFDGELHKAGD